MQNLTPQADQSAISKKTTSIAGTPKRSRSARNIPSGTSCASLGGHDKGRAPTARLQARLVSAAISHTFLAENIDNRIHCATLVQIVHPTILEQKLH
jgi:hypothetical protein